MITESENPASANIDLLSTAEIITIINDEDKKVATAVERVLPKIAEVVDGVTERMQRGGRLVYFGAGTSGRLGVLDASECPPTFGTPKDLVIGCIAGGAPALTDAIENAEDFGEEALAEIEKLHISEKDSVIGLSANGNPEYVLAAVREAKQRGAFTVGVSCNPVSQLLKEAEVGIEVVVGPEVIAGSSRMKAGTAQKMVCNMITTSVMVKLGKTFGNLMVDLKPVNKKMLGRQKRIVARVCNITEDAAALKLTECGGETKTAIVSLLHNLPPDAARARLSECGGIIRKVV